MPPRTWPLVHSEALQWPSPPSLTKTILIYKWKSHVPGILSLLSRPRQMDNAVSWSSDSLSLSFGKTVIFQNGSWIRKPGGLVPREQDMNKYILRELQQIFTQLSTLSTLLICAHTILSIFFHIEAQISQTLSFLFQHLSQLKKHLHRDWSMLNCVEAKDVDVISQTLTTPFWLANSP